MYMHNLDCNRADQRLMTINTNTTIDHTGNAT